MKTPIITILAAAVMVPALAFAADDMKVTQSSDSEITVESEAPATKRSGFFSFLDIFKTTTKTTVTENARSDTDFMANHPNPGKTTTTVEVQETVKYR